MATHGEDDYDQNQLVINNQSSASSSSSYVDIKRYVLLGGAILSVITCGMTLTGGILEVMNYTYVYEWIFTIIESIFAFLFILWLWSGEIGFSASYVLMTLLLMILLVFLMLKIVDNEQEVTSGIYEICMGGVLLISSFLTIRATHKAW